MPGQIQEDSFGPYAVLLTHSGRALKVDPELYSALSGIAWYDHPRGYAFRKLDHNRTQFLHRYILGAQPGEVTDHANRDRADNRRANLRICTQAENLRNRPVFRSNRLGLKGVSWEPRRGKFIVHIAIDGKVHHVGQFDTAAEAAQAYNEAAVKHHGKFASLNDISGETVTQCNR